MESGVLEGYGTRGRLTPLEHIEAKSADVRKARKRVKSMVGGGRITVDERDGATAHCDGMERE